MGSCGEQNGNVVFGCDGATLSLRASDMSFADGVGAFMHEDCYAYLSRKVKFYIVYKDLPFVVNKFGDVEQHPSIKFGKVQEYWAQDFEYDELVQDGNAYMLESPLTNKRNASRINKIISQYKIKKGRKGPATSATFYAEGAIKMGENGKFWKKVNGKWAQLPDMPIYITLKVTKYPFKIPQSGHFNTVPLFISSVEKVKKTMEIIFVGSEKCIEKLKRRKM